METLISNVNYLYKAQRLAKVKEAIKMRLRKKHAKMHLRK
jgi:hypothetical protein